MQRKTCKTLVKMWNDYPHHDITMKILTFLFSLALGSLSLASLSLTVAGLLGGAAGGVWVAGGGADSFPLPDCWSNFFLSSPDLLNIPVVKFRTKKHEELHMKKK